MVSSTWFSTKFRSLKNGKQFGAIARAGSRIEFAVSRQDANLVLLVDWRKGEACLSDEREQLVSIGLAI